MNAETKTVKMNKNKDCRGSVRFDAPETMPPAVVGNVYIARSFPGIEFATEVEVTITITKSTKTA